ncbi:MAG: precorrin-8X methylmutase [Proteobacteria bacterium]|nr:precorrin-8X methylmutase [Pseudomonadota bacterium]
MKPQDIETMSFQIIESEAGNHGFSDEHWPIVRRMVHTSADFEYIKSIRFHPDAVAAGVAAIRAGKNIITDTTMALSGIRKASINGFGGQVFCHVADPEISRKAKEQGVTRSRLAVDEATSDMDGGIYAIGNAPTALLRLMELIREKKATPALVLGFPVGFVNAAESKAELLDMDIPYITNVGRKGGSNIAAAVVNALIIMAESAH